MPLLFPIESEESLDEGVHETGDRRYDLLHALASLAAVQEQNLEERERERGGERESFDFVRHFDYVSDIFCC